ncbi:MAG: protein jag [Ruminococcaceae bacterium]|nr:protein jag [Oscillospiraceae bacterium]
MKKEVVISAKTVEEALELAARELGADSVEKLEYTVDEEPKKGFLGIGATLAKITATYNVGGEEDALAMVKELLANMNVESTVTMTDGEAGEKKITVEGGNAAILIGHHGETLDALQYLANLAANKKVNGEKREYVKISVDVEGYRAKREETLRALARRMAEKVLKYKKSVMLEPMNPYERRIIHSEVQKIEGVSTNSIGSDSNRKVVMYLDTKKA